MLMGSNLLTEHGMKFDGFNIEILKIYFRPLKRGTMNFTETQLKKIQSALIACYGDREISLQQLSTTFRRGDLLEMLAL